MMETKHIYRHTILMPKMTKLTIALVLLSLCFAVPSASALCPSPKAKPKVERSKPKPKPRTQSNTKTQTKPKPQKQQSQASSASAPQKQIPSAADGQINGHGYVDLALPSGTKWATCNVGADSPTADGDYFAWGETTPKSIYTEENSRTYGDSSYNHEISGNSNLDAASANWGNRWKLPTEAQMQELIDNCDSEWTSINGVNGRLFTSKRNGKSIFLPAAGWRNSSVLEYRGEDGNYWSGSPDESYSNIAYYLYFLDSNVRVGWSGRNGGLVVRGVVPE